MAISAGLEALLRRAKTTDLDFSWRSVAEALAPIYYSKMTLMDVIEVVLTLYEEALGENRFQLPGRGDAAKQILLAPIKGTCAIELFGPNSLDTPYTVEQFYNAMLARMMNNLRVARVDWCWKPE